MIFSTYTYALFLAATFVTYWMAPRPVRPWLLIGASYFFYATWKAPYVLLLLAVSLFNWAYARYVLSSEVERPVWPGVVVNVAVLVYFKYAAFCVVNAVALLGLVGIEVAAPQLSITLPLGVSFFTFQGIAYLVDVASGTPPITQLRDFLLYKAFWPQLIAGPIIRPDEIRDQISELPRLRYDDVAEGSRRILLGAFKKVALADSLGQHVDLAFIGHASPHALDTLAGVIGFGFQIYFDFSAYSDFAIGSARLFGFRFPENFDWPYRARSPQDFWNRWHMSLSRWIRDYVFTPLTFATRHTPALAPLWLVLAMALCGLWHGAAWTFVAWGTWHGMALAVQQGPLKRLFASTSWATQIAGFVLTSVIVFVGWLLFRAPTLTSVAEHLSALLTFRGGLRPALIRENGVLTIGCLALSAWSAALGRALFPTIALGHDWLRYLRPVGYALLLVAVVVLDQEAKAFVYFQF